MGKSCYSPEEMKNSVERLRSEADRHDLQPHNLAADLIENCRKNSDVEGMKFWRAVWIQIMSDEYIVSRPQAKRPPKRPQLPGEDG